MLVSNVQLIDSIKQLSLLKNSSHKFPEDRFSVHVGWTRTAMNYDNTFRRYFSGLRVVEEEKNNIVNTPPSGGRRRWTAGAQAGPGGWRARGRARIAFWQVVFTRMNSLRSSPRGRRIYDAYFSGYGVRPTMNRFFPSFSRFEII